MRTNNEGLTFTEWLAAAAVKTTERSCYKAAWLRGEDPTDYRAAKHSHWDDPSDPHFDCMKDGEPS